MEKLTAYEISLIQHILSEIVEKAKPAYAPKLVQVENLHLIADQIETLKGAIIKMQ